MPVRLERGPSALSPLRTVALAIGFGCAFAATLTIFLTDNAQTLRIGILIALWGFVFAALAAGRKQTEQAVAAGTELELRKSYEAELEREVAARREYELRLEVQLRRELQDNFSAQVGDLREEMSQLRRELSEQWDSELRVERMVMRTQSVRMGSERREALEPGAASLSSPATIEAAPVQAQSDDATPVQSTPAESSSWDATSYLGDDNMHQDGYDGTSQPNGGGQFDGSSQYDFIPQYAGDPVPNTHEFPAVATGARPQPTAPVPPLLAPASIPSPPLTPDRPTPASSTTVEPTTHESGDVLARVLAEAGASPGRSRRRHRYADEEED